MTTKGDNTPTNTLREEVLEILRYPNNKRPERFTIATQIRHFQADQLVELIAQAVNKARNDSLLDLERWIKLHDLDTEMILDGIEHMVVSNLQVPDQPRLDNTDRIKELETPNQVESME